MYGPVSLLFVNLLLVPIFFRRKEDFLTPIFTVIAVLLSFIYFSKTEPEPKYDGQETVTLSWKDSVKIDGNKMKGIAKTASDELVYAIYTFKTEQEKTSFAAMNLPAYTFTLSGSFQEPAIPSHSYAFSMESYLRMYGASGVFQSKEVLQVEENQTFRALLSEQRRKVKRHIESSFPETLKVEAEALLIGDRSGMDEEAATIYRRLGITHLFAISGLHVGLLTFLFRELFLRMHFRKETVTMFLIVSLPMYAVIAGGAPSVWRAVSVTVLILLTTFSELKIDSLNALSVSAIVFILYEPFVLFQPGFQLSYIAAFSLVLSSSLLTRTKTMLGASFLVTVISQLALYPILLYHFYELSLSSFVVNLLYVPLYSFVILPMNIVLLFVSFALPPIAQFLFSCYVPFRQWIEVLTAWLASIPYQLWTPGRPASFLMMFALGGEFLFFYHFEKSGKPWRALQYVLLPALLIHIYPYTDGALKVTYLDVGQGDSAVIELPYRRAVYVIDAGGTVLFGESDWSTPEKTFEVGRQIVVPFLKGNGITKVDKLILSHPHLDHVGGAHEVLEEVRVDEIHLTPGSEGEKEMTEVIRLAEEKNVPLVAVRDGATWMEGRFPFVYVGPQGEAYAGGNNSSLVLLFNAGKLSFLFTGDMEQEAEAEFVKKYEGIDFGPLILKVGHHGSKTSSTVPFVDALRPRLAIISAGRNNIYGHPHDEVMETFEMFGVPTLTTAEYGSITVTVQNDGYRIHADHQRKWTRLP